MKRTKIILLFALVFSSFLTLPGFVLDVKADTYTINEGVEFTYTMISPIEEDLSIRITYSTNTTVRGSVTEIFVSGTCRTAVDQDITDYIYHREFIDGDLAAASIFENVTYAGKTVEAHTSSIVPGMAYIAVMNTTGIILNITNSAGSFYLSSWEFQAECPPGIPGYEIPVLMALIFIGSLGIVIYIRKRLRILGR